LPTFAPIYVGENILKIITLAPDENFNLLLHRLSLVGRSSIVTPYFLTGLPDGILSKQKSQFG
jgi:hypothetical protein